MTISTLKALPTGRYQLELSDGTRQKLEQSVVLDCGLYAGMDLDQQAWQRVLEAQQKASAKARAVRIAASTAVSEAELRRRLRQRGEDPDSADEAVDWLKDLGALDDEALARRVVQQAQAKGYGKARIKQMLYQKGVDRACWDKALEDFQPSDEAIDLFLQKRLGGSMPDRKEQQRVIDALRRRGFGWEEIRRGLDRYGAEVEELE